jgi:hypothetical protein
MESCLQGCLSPLARTTHTKKMNENPSISMLISREEAGNYGNQFVHVSIHPSDGTLEDSSQMHVQAPLATENDVSTLVSPFNAAPEKPAAGVDCGVPLPFDSFFCWRRTSTPHGPSNDASF